jgi:signal transduction histidine kinase
VLDELGLLPAVRERARQFQTADPDQLRVVVEAPDSLPPLPAAVEVAAYRIVSEALMNVVRHADARTCTIRLAMCEAEGVLRVEVVDDGKGIPAEHRAGVGLRSMRERAGELGGSASIASDPHGGTRVEVELPAA